jgi:hypothetical protein
MFPLSRGLQHEEHARSLLGGGHVDPPDAGGRHRGPGRVSVHHAGKPQVARELRPAGHQLEAVDLADALPDDAEVVAVHEDAVLAAFCTALTIFP